jgi:aspartate racemase
MKPISIGIIGGAGPMAGVMLLQRIFTLAGSQYGCFRDVDFPEVQLLSFPFSEMLTDERDEAKVREELSSCLNRLRSSGATVFAIACNTLHAFLDQIPDGLIHLPQVTAREIPYGEIPLVLCTSTSSQFGLHKRFFPCAYPSTEDQCQVDRLIDLILKGENVAEQLSLLIEKQRASVIVLGCTELSLFSKDLTETKKLIIDPLEIMANKILEQAFVER